MSKNNLEDQCEKLRKERDYYRNRLNELGASFLALQEAHARIRLENERRGMAAKMIAESARMMIFASGIDDIYREFLTTILQTSLIDRAILLECKPCCGKSDCMAGDSAHDEHAPDDHAGQCIQQHYSCTVKYNLGFEPLQEHSFQFAGHLPTFTFFNGGESGDNVFTQFSELLGATNLLWVFDRNSGWGLLIGNERNDRIFHRPFQDTDREIYEGTLKIFINILWRLESEEESLRERERRFALISEQYGEIIWETDAKGIYNYVSGAIQTILNYRPDEVTGRMCFADFLPVESREDYYKNYFKKTAIAGSIMNEQHKVLARDGREIWLVTTAEPILDEEGRRVKGWRGFHRDITEQKLIEEERAVLEQRYWKEQRMGSIGRLAGGLAHDMNNLLTPIIGYSEILLEEFSARDERRDFMKNILDASTKAQSLVSRLLAFSRKQAMALKSIDINRVIFDFETILRSLIKDDIAMELNIRTSQPSIAGDCSQLEQVLMNLAINAQQAMPNGGKLTITTDMEQSDGEVASVIDDMEYLAGDDVIPAGTYVTLSLSDTGEGIDRDCRDNLFEPFFSTRPSGTGLGLSSIQGIIKQHKGYVRLYSQKNVGTLQKIYFPEAEITQEVSVPEKEIENTADKPVVTGLTALVADDNEMVRNLAVSVLERDGYKVLKAGNGAELLAQIDEYVGPVHYLVTDIVMPGMSGPSLADQVLLRYPECRIIFMSGYNETVMTGKGMLEKNTYFLQKPFRPSALLALLDKVEPGIAVEL